MRRGKELEVRRRTLEAQREALIGERKELAQKNRLRQRVAGFAEKTTATIDKLDFAQRQKLLRLVVEEVRVKGWQVEIRLRIPLDGPPDPPNQPVSTRDRLRPLHEQQFAELQVTHTAELALQQEQIATQATQLGELKQQLAGSAERVAKHATTA